MSIHQLGALIKTWLIGVLSGWGVPGDLSRLLVEMVTWAVGAVLCIVAIMLAALVFIYLERKISGYIQSRLGPTRCGPIGLLQSFADVVKLLLKEDIVPKDADWLMHTIGPIMFLAVSALAYIVVPWDEGATVAGRVDGGIGLLFAVAVGSMGLIGIVAGGWGSNNKWSLLGAIRTAAQMVSYELPMLLALMCVVLQAESLSLAAIVGNQKGSILAWNIARPWMWLPLVLFLISGVAEINRTPFDIPEAESELVSGFHTEYSGMKFALFFLAEYGNLLLVALMFSVIFLGGWLSPFGYPDPLCLPGLFWLLAKAMFMVVIMMWVRWTLPRLRVDQLMLFSWKLMLPAGFLALGITCAVILLGWA